MRPNVVMLVLDAARRDALEPYGAAPGSTPAIAQLARRGTALPDVYATSSWTVPSHASIFTGLLPRAAGLSRVASPAEAKPVLEAQWEQVLPHVMRRAGYITRAASANLWLSAASGFDTGFDDFVQIDTNRTARFATRQRLRWLVEAARGRVDDGAATMEATVGHWLEQRPERPFFWFLNLVECHSPYLPPRPYGNVTVIERLRAAQDARHHYTLVGIWRACAGLTRLPEATLDRMRRLYRASISYMDDWLGRLLERLDDAGVLDDTLVIVTADHGENLGEGGLLAHALSLDNRLIHVPLVMCGPGAGTGSINSLADLPRLVAGATGVDGHPWRDGPPQGFGVAQLDPPVDAGDAEATEAAVRAGLADALDLLTTPLTCAVAGALKLVRRGEHEELYDLDADPLEVQPQHPDKVAANGRGEQVAALREALAHPAVSSRRPRQPSPGSAAAASAEELRELEERMRLLGYM